MKNQMMMAGLLTMTAGLASQVIAPTYAEAAQRSEKKWAKNILLKVALPARFKDYDGRISTGAIYLNVEQMVSVQEFPNQLKTEMSGLFYFESDTADQHNDGVPYKTWTSVAGTDGSVLLDLVHKEGNENTYAVYGCSSTSRCEQENFSVKFAGNKASIDLLLGQESGLEVLMPLYDSLGQVIGSEWRSTVYEASTISLPPVKN